MNIKDFFQKKGASSDSEEAVLQADAAPTGAPVVQGPLKTAGADAASSLRKKPIALALAGVVVLLGGGAYVAYILSPGFGSSAVQAPKVRPSAHAQQFNVPQVSKPKPPAASQAVAPTVSPTAPVVRAAPGKVATESSPAPNAAKANKAQEARLAAMITGTGAATTGWKTDSAAGHAASASVLPSAALRAAATLPKPQTSVYSTHLVRKEISPYELLQGTVIPAVLETGIKSDLPGMITAVVNQPVYSSVSGALVLIPAGSKLIGLYQSHVIAGATRVGVVWDRILFPNGTYMQIGKSEGYSPEGYAGFHDLVNDHTWTIFKNALLLSLIDVGMSVASPSSSSNSNGGVTGNAALQDGEQSLAQTFGQAESQMFQKYINLAPTLTIRPGYVFNVIVGKDLVFPGPYRHGNQFEKQAPASAAAPTMVNPYG